MICSCLEIMFLFGNNRAFFGNNMVLYWITWKSNAFERKQFVFIYGNNMLLSGNNMFLLENDMFLFEKIHKLLEAPWQFAAWPCLTCASWSKSGNNLAGPIWQSDRLNRKNPNLKISNLRNPNLRIVNLKISNLKIPYIKIYIILRFTIVSNLKISILRINFKIV